MDIGDLLLDGVHCSFIVPVVNVDDNEWSID